MSAAVQLTDDDTAALFTLLHATYNRPDLFATRVLLVPSLRTWQVEACRHVAEELACGNTNLRIVIRTCHGAGKTFFAAMILLWFMVTRYNSRGMTTAPTWSQVESALWPEIAKLYNRSILRALKFGRLLNTELHFGDAWFAKGASSDRPENLEGQHSDLAAIRIVDEAKAVDATVFEATEGLLSAPESFDLWISTPSLETGNFYERDMSTDANVLRAVIDVDQLINDERMSEDERRGFRVWKAERAAEWGEESAEFGARVMARYIDNAEGALFPSSWIERAMSQTFEVYCRQHETPKAGCEKCAVPVMAGMDVAGSVDGDQNAVALTYGPDSEDRIEIRSVAAWNERDTMKSKGRAISIAKPLGAPLRVDTIGIGKGVADSIAADGYPMQEYRASEKPKDDKRFTNRKAEDAWSLRTRYEKGKIRLPNDQKLKSQKRAMRYEILQTGKLRVVDPEDSPDLVDAVMIASAPARIGFATYAAEDF